MFQVGAGAGAGIYVSLGAGAELFFYSEPESEPLKNRAAPEHW